MRIAIVDDQTADRAKLRGQLEPELAQRGLDAVLEQFASGEAFLEAFTPGRFAAVFLDIYMDTVSGIEVARQLYQKDPRCKIVFLSVSKDHALEGYSVRATYYLVKPISQELLAQALDICFPAHAPGDILLVRTKEGSIPVQRREILYIESVVRHGCVHLTDQMLESCDSFSILTAPLAGDHRFLLCGRGLLIQMEHIVAQREDEFIMEDGRRLPISRRLRGEVLEVFRNFALNAMVEK